MIKRSLICSLFSGALITLPTHAFDVDKGIKAAVEACDAQTLVSVIGSFEGRNPPPGEVWETSQYLHKYSYDLNLRTIFYRNNTPQDVKTKCAKYEEFQALLGAMNPMEKKPQFWKSTDVVSYIATHHD